VTIQYGVTGEMRSSASFDEENARSSMVGEYLVQRTLGCGAAQPGPGEVCVYASILTFQFPSDVVWRLSAAPGCAFGGR